MSTKAKAKQRKLDLPSAKKRPFKKKGTSLKDSLPKETARKDLIDSTKPEPGSIHTILTYVEYTIYVLTKRCVQQVILLLVRCTDTRTFTSAQVV